MDTRLPALSTPEQPFDPLSLAPGAKAVWLEIGFGGGEHLAAQAARHPEILCLGVEPFENGVASAVRHIDEAGLANVRLHKGDARDLMRWLPPACLDRVFILFPDPWPKARHNKRRLVGEAFLRDLAVVMKPGARLRFATDWADYADQVLCLTTKSPDFQWTARTAEDWRVAPADHIPTRYQEKRLGDCVPIWLEFERV
jgi:tRNA (guanine-N7-)-methyltransferase